MLTPVVIANLSFVGSPVAIIRNAELGQMSPMSGPSIYWVASDNTFSDISILLLGLMPFGDGG
jgi:hypothetical protein